MPERPLILFPSPERADREKKSSVFKKSVFPSPQKQYSRLQPQFQVLQTAFKQKSVTLQQTSAGIDPEFALVFEIIGTVDNFYTAVRHTEGLEWLFDCELEPIESDEEFYSLSEDGDKSNELLEGKLYCVMSNQNALEQLLSLWERYQNGETNIFQRGFAGLRDVFTHIKKIRKWGPEDRIAETHVLEYWRESLSLDGDIPIPFEIELFFRNERRKRNSAFEVIQKEINILGGRVLQECVLGEVCYHGVLVELPRKSIENLMNHYDEIELTKVDDIMFFRPTCQAMFYSKGDSLKCDIDATEVAYFSEDAIVAVFDGMPMQNHRLLTGRVIVDDPDDYSEGYESKYRKHGTSMASLVIYGDLNRGLPPINSPIYMRPILKPIVNGPESIVECVPSDSLLIDTLHRAVKRMMEGDESKAASAPTVKVVNLSIGDPVRQLAATMSPLSRMLDYLSMKCSILFIISAGNHPEISDYTGLKFDELKKMDISNRNHVFGRAIRENQRNLKVLSPAESINNLTIGALYDDFSTEGETERAIFAVEKGMPSPISAVGKGYRSIITPDLYYYGGRKYLVDRINKMEWNVSLRAPGCKSAVPYDVGEDGCGYTFGTSDAAAQLTHEAVLCYEVLNQVFLSEKGTPVPPNETAILIKAMLTHGASWDSLAEKLADSMEDSPKRLGKWIGNGIPNINRVVGCTKERITLIGLGSLKNGEGDVFRLPLPVDFSSRIIKRRLIVTLAYFSPIVANKQQYRGAQIWFNIDDGGKKLVDHRQNSEWQAVRKGTLQHEIFIGNEPIVWDDEDLRIKVNCKEDAGKIDKSIPYCIFVTFEVAEGFDVDLYTNVSTRINQKVKIGNVY